MSDNATPAVPAPDPYAERAAERTFPSRLPAPADVPASPPPIVASGPGNRGPGWLLRGRHGEGDGGAAA